MDPSDFHPGPGCFRFLIQFGWWPPHLPGWISSTGQQIFKNMPTLLPRESMAATSVVPATIQRPSPSVHRVGFSTSFTRLLMGSLALRPALLLCGNSRPRVAATPLPHATGAYGQLPGRDFNPLDLLLLLRTDATLFSFQDALSDDTVILYPQFFPSFEQTSPYHKAALFRRFVATLQGPAVHHPQLTTRTNR